MVVNNGMLAICVVLAQASLLTPGAARAQGPVGAVATPAVPLRTTPPGVTANATGAQEHPLMPVLRWAKQGLVTIENLTDYSAVLAKRERIGGQLSEYQYLSLKIRHRPFSVYADFLGPAALAGQEVLYVAGQNNGKLWAPRPHLQATVSVEPGSPVAMRDQHYPLTEIGLVNLVRRLIEVGQQDVKYGECEVKFFQGAKVNKRLCTVIQVVHPRPRREFRFHLARIYVDSALNLPVRFESYDWPRAPGGPPELIEEYTYLGLKLNNGFTDVDFSLQNPSYRFR